MEGNINCKNNNNKILLASDYDQTFYLNDDDIKINIECVSKFRENNNIFVIATGRSYQDLKNKEKIYNFSYDYAVINHGATIIDSNDNILLNYSIDDEITKKIIDDLELEYSEKYFYCNLDNSRCNPEDGNLTKINVTYNSDDKAFYIINKIMNKYDKYINCFHITHNSIEIISNKTNKAFAIDEIIKLENITQTYTIGDGYSDIEMIKKFNGYCMKDSVDELIRICGEKVVNSVSELIKELV